MFLRRGTLGIAFAAFAASRCWAGDLDLPETAVAAPANPASTLDEPIRQIADTPAGCAVLDKDFPGLRQHAMYDFFKSMTLKQIAALSKGQITQEMLAQAQTDLLALKAASGPTVGASMATVPVTTAAVATTEP